MSKRVRDRDDDDEDEDYMSEKYLAAAAQAVAPQLLNHRNRRLQPPPPPAPIRKEKSRHLVEVEQREQGLSTALPSDNKGFQLLKKMGYKEGTKLGNNPSNGLIEPIPIRILSSRSGLGEESVKKEKVLHKQQTDQRIQSTYQDHLKQKYYLRRTRAELNKCQAVCERLDRENFHLEENILWKSKQDQDKNDNDEDEEKEEDNDPTDLSAIESKLKLLTCYLREKHFYCLWCGETFENCEQLESNCPGNERDLH